jgi:hypothetical protein
VKDSRVFAAKADQLQVKARLLVNENCGCSVLTSHKANVIFNTPGTTLEQAQANQTLCWATRRNGGEEETRRRARWRAMVTALASDLPCRLFVVVVV